jgi:hypothetical protein
MSGAKAKFIGLQEGNTLKVDFEDSDLTAPWQVVGLEYPVL